MSNFNGRISKLEKTASRQIPQTIDVYGTRPDGRRYLIDSWKSFVDAANAGEIIGDDWVKLTPNHEEIKSDDNDKKPIATA